MMKSLWLWLVEQLAQLRVAESDLNVRTLTGLCEKWRVRAVTFRWEPGDRTTAVESIITAAGRDELISGQKS